VSGYVAWVKVSGCWRAVAEGDTLAECDGRLMNVIRAMPRVPIASAVLPAGVHPGNRTAKNEDDALPRPPGPPPA